MTAKKAVEAMVDILEELEKAKEQAQRRLKATYQEYVRDMQAVGRLPLPEKILKKVANAILKDKDMELLSEYKSIMQIFDETEVC